MAKTPLPRHEFLIRPTEQAWGWLEEMATDAGMSVNAWIEHMIRDAAKRQGYGSPIVGSTCPDCLRRTCTCGADHLAKIKANAKEKPNVADK